MNPVPFELIEKLRALFSRMEEEYSAAAVEYGFSCEGCEENCCTTGFQHHTVLEFELLRSGIEKFSPEEREEVKERSRIALIEKNSGGNPRCPLLLNNRCTLYEYRPMVCRLHGLPYVLDNPVRGRIAGDGCVPFQNTYDPPFRAVIDRTPFYIEFAELERQARVSSKNEASRYARSIPEIILDILG